MIWWLLLIWLTLIVAICFFVRVGAVADDDNALGEEAAHPSAFQKDAP